MKKKQKHSPQSKPLPGKGTDTGLIKQKLDEAGQFKKPLQAVNKFSNKGDTIV